MIDADVEAERLQHARAADAEHDLLLEAVLGIAAIKAVRDLPVLGFVLIEIGVEQENRHAVTERRADDMQPGADPDLSPFDGYRDHRAQRLGPCLGIPRVFMIDLPPFGTDLLLEIARPAYQGHEDHRQLEIRAGTRRVAGKHPEAAAVGVHLRTERDLHRKIGNTRALQPWIKRSCRGTPPTGPRYQKQPLPIAEET